jgi:hypothetical protein
MAGGDFFWDYICDLCGVWEKGVKDDGVFFGSLALRSLRRGHLLFHPAQWHEPGYLRNLALDLVERRVGSVGGNSHGHPNLASRDPSTVQIFTLVL